MAERLIMVPDESTVADRADITLPVPQVVAEVRDDIVLGEAKPSPQLLNPSESPQKHKSTLTEVDLEVLRRHSQPYNEPLMGFHIPSECPHCRSNSAK